MGLRVEKKENETPQKLVKRFLMRLRRSGILKTARKKMFRERPLSERAKKEAALRRERIIAEKKKLEKLGKL